MNSKNMTREKLRENLSWTGYSGHKSICQKHRELWQHIEGNAAAEELLMDAHAFAKKMDDKLREYCDKYGGKNPNDLPQREIGK